MKTLTYNMKTHVAIYDKEELAYDAIDLLKTKGFPIEKVSMVERADIVTEQIKATPIESVKLIPFISLVVIGTIIGVLASIDVIDIPGLGFLGERDVPAFIGGFIGFDIGLILATIVTIIITIITRRRNLINAQKRVDVNYLIVITGNITDIEKAEHILGTSGIHKHKLLCNYCKVKNI